MTNTTPPSRETPRDLKISGPLLWVLIAVGLAAIVFLLMQLKDVDEARAYTRQSAICLDANGVVMPDTQRLVRDGKTLGYRFPLNGKEVTITAPGEVLDSHIGLGEDIASRTAFHLYRCLDRSPTDLRRELLRDMQRQGEDGTADSAAGTPAPPASGTPAPTPGNTP